MARRKGSKDAKPRKRKTRADAPGAEAAAAETPAGIGHNSDTAASRLTLDQERELFAQHRGQWANYQNKLKAAEEIGTKVKAALKADGFLVLHMRIADDLGNPKGEKKVTSDITERLKVARWIGHAMGRQADLFEQPDRTPIIDRAYDDGKQASIEGRLRQPPHDPSTEAYRSWMQGFSDHQEELVKRVGAGEERDRMNGLGDVIAEGDRIINDDGVAAILNAEQSSDTSI